MLFATLTVSFFKSKATKRKTTDGNEEGSSKQARHGSISESSRHGSISESSDIVEDAPTDEAPPLSLLAQVQQQLANVQTQHDSLKGTVMNNSVNIQKNTDQIALNKKQINRNEANSRQRNLRFYGFDKDKVETLDQKERSIFKSFLKDGLQLADSKINSIMANIDIIHWVEQGKCLIVAFCRRADISFMKSQRKKLENYKPHGKLISMEDDLTKDQQETKKKCTLPKLHDMKSKKDQYKNVHYHSWNKIAANGVVKTYDKW